MVRKKNGKDRLRRIPALAVLVLLGVLILAAPSGRGAFGDSAKEMKGADPFESFLRTDREHKTRVRPLSPLEKYNIGDLKLLGIAVSGKKRMAMIQDPDGKFHTLSRGMWIGPNEGRVMAISVSQVVIEETLYGPSGEKQKNRVVLDLYSENTDGEKP